MKFGKTGNRLALLVLLLAPMPVLSASVGMVKSSSGAVSIVRAGTSMPAPVGTAIEATDTIQTGKDGRVGLTFKDNSRMALGPGSTLAIDRFEFDAKTHEGRFDSTLQRGTLSAVSGKLAKQSPKAMTLRTRSTVLAVRGTEFIVSSR